MIGRRFSRNVETDEADMRGFDAFELRLGDLMRGERATLGKSLLDVERELRIKANYVAAIENADPSAFDTPGFIPGYVRSYARYLGMDPDQAFTTFCAESGFSIAHGMSAEASSIRKPGAMPVRKTRAQDPLIAPNTPFLPASESFLARIEPGAIGSALVLVALIGAIGYGGWSVLRQVQQVQLAPVENTPVVLADLDPLSGAAVTRDEALADAGDAAGVFQPPRDERLSRLYRPKALDVPVMVARDAPISTLDPREVGTLSPTAPEADRASGIELALREAQGFGADALATPKVVADGPPDLQVVAVRPAWVRVRGADGSVIFEGILNAGDTYDVPATEEPPTLRVGESGAVYFAVNGQHYGPAGARGSVTSDLALTPETLTERYAVADISADQDLMQYVAELTTDPAAQD
ncbi:cytoskeletal protein RodZ [Roseovarius tolerans]|uniref:Cytoskeletal protein RodZ n=1 Tax=Roseovarius tolerans TaxID=74031 RepID=A0A0L6CVM0_9RHOB|nr:helix-turn-helix domain-containing protein [Roseovarius tolerans]KNX41786.1 cytoskeletal protein RodZ [Roseovarius tolerans]